MLKVKCQAHVRTEKSMHMSFHEMEASAPFVSAGLGTVEAGPAEVFPVAEVLGNNNFQCVINEHSALGHNQRYPKKKSAHWELCSQAADTASLYPVEWNGAKIMPSCWNTPLYLYPK